MKPGFLFIFTISACFPILMAAQTTYKVGAGQSYTSIGAVPWESLSAGDSVLIYWRSTAYKEKWVINRAGQADKWIVVKGISNASGQLPVIDGQDATTRSQLNFWNEERGVIKIGGSNTPADGMPAYIKIENLEIRNGRDSFSFTGRNGVAFYNANAAAIYVEKVENLAIVNCILTNCGNGFFSSSNSKNVLVEGCYIYGNGNVGSIYEHNNYTETQGITFQYNHFGPLLSGALGNNLKDRSAGTVIRYNWIESGNRQLDLVESDYTELVNLGSYRSTYVYGNILIEPDGAGNSQICHYGGDGDDETLYRKGKLYFYNNTIISTRTGNTTLFRLSTNSETADCYNNIIYVTATGNRLAMLDSDGVLNLNNNWMKTGWVDSHSGLTGTINNLGNNITGTSPGFANEVSQDFQLLQTSDCVDKGTNTPVDYPVNYEYIKHQNKVNKNISGIIDLGAYEYSIPLDVNDIRCEKISISPNPASNEIFVKSPINMHKLTIINSSGKELMKIAPKNNEAFVDIQNFSNGIYILKLETTAGTIVKKFIKE